MSPFGEQHSASMHVARPVVIRQAGKRQSRVAEEIVFGIYARFSDDHQHESSITRQVECCRAYAESVKARVFDVYGDRDRTGATMWGRDELQRLLDDVAKGYVTGVLIERLDRLSRDQTDTHIIARMCRRHGVDIYEAGSGKVDKLRLAFGSLMSQEERERLLYLTSNGLRAAIREGRTYVIRFGYVADPHNPGVRSIQPERAAVVRQLYEMCDAGLSAKDLARWMTGRHPTPRDCANGDHDPRSHPPMRHWTAALIRSLLRSPMYKGVLIYGATETVRDHDMRITGYRERPEDEWIAVECDDLRIVDDALWWRVQEKVQPRHEVEGRRKSVPPLLSSAVRCGRCSGTMTTGRSGRKRLDYTCAAVERDDCQGCGRVPVAWTEHVVIEAIAESVGSDRVRKYKEAFLATFDKRLQDYETETRRLRGDFAKVERAINHSMTEGAMEGASVERKRKFRQELEQQSAEIRRSLERRSPPTRDVRGDVEDAELRTGLQAMIEHLPFKAADPASAKLANAVRAIVRSVLVVPPGDAGEMELVASLDLGHVAFHGPIALTSSRLETRTIRMDVAEREAHDKRIRDRPITEEYARFVGDVPKDVWDREVAVLGRDALEISRRGWHVNAFARTALFLVTKGIHPSKMPDIDGPGCEILPILTALRRSGGWQRVEDDIRRAHPEIGGAIQADLVATWTRYTSLVDAGPAIARLAFSDRLAEQSSNVADPRTSARLRLVSRLALNVGSRKLGCCFDMRVAWTNVTVHLAEFLETSLRTPDVDRLVCIDLADASVLREFLRGVACPDMYIHCTAILSRLEGGSFVDIASETGWNSRYVKACVTLPDAELRARLCKRSWYPRERPVKLPARMLEIAASMIAKADASTIASRRRALIAVGMHMEGRGASEIHTACGVDFKQLAAWLDVYGVLGVAGLLISATSIAVSCDPETLAIDDQEILAEAERVDEQAKRTSDPRLRAELSAVALDMRGLSRHIIHGRTGIPPNIQPGCSLRYRTRGTAKARQGNRLESLTLPQIEELKAIAASGNDPLRPGCSVTVRSLIAFCEETYDRTVRPAYLRRLLNRHGLRLRGRGELKINQVLDRPAAVAERM